ncbi:hypothetical protein CBS76997_11428 [Aspergillus niger]|nr:hypothetical protein CBS13152_11412 [Aspergillus niger]KAI2866554.1 hypothetical protein CBS11852_11490 [Aspergillus niger]KAI2946295.1 hypothetical protein CBS147323_11270 [Aspergillus niger]KAI3031919.1 hypothetical protein CBS76997_11428 [Aspergillus niger]
MGSSSSPFNMAGEGKDIFHRTQTQNERVFADQTSTAGEGHPTAPPSKLQTPIAAQASHPPETGSSPAESLAQSYLDRHPRAFRASFRRPERGSDASNEATDPYTRIRSPEPESDRTVDLGFKIDLPVLSRTWEPNVFDAWAC